MHQEFLPEAATFNRRLALHCLTTNRRNRICLYHYFVKNGKIHDGSADSKFKVTGTPYPRTVNKKGKQEIPVATGYMHCGCSEDVALLDFYFWKTWKVMNEAGDEEGLRHQHIEPRLRLFFSKCYEADAMLTVDDLYTGGSVAAEKQCIKLQIRRLKERLAELEEEIPDGGKLFFK